MRTIDRWEGFGLAVLVEHALSPAPVAELGLLDTCRCSCGLPAACCEVRLIAARFGLDTVAAERSVS
jgi:hypothetical protein